MPCYPRYMFRHKGKHRSFIQNLKLASLLSLVAGIVNVSGFFAISTLTTNVTGHFAYFADELVKNRWYQAQVHLLYIIAFFLGAFFSSFCVEYVATRKPGYTYVLPLLLEMTILTAISLLGITVLQTYAQLIASILLFAMGMQNALVTSVSNSVVRTTHLTGLFTDLGIEISQLFFYKEVAQKLKLKSSIQLRLAIISFFFLGCLVGGYGYIMLGMPVLLLAVLGLSIGLGYDTARLKIVSIKRKYQKRD